MFLNQDQIAEIAELINYQHLLFIASNVGSQVLSKSEIKILKSFGVDINALDKITLLEQSFRFGMVSSAIGQKQSKKLSYQQFLKYLGDSSYQPLTEVELGALEFAQRQAAKDIKGLGNRIANNFESSLIEIDQAQAAKYGEIITNTSVQAIKNRESAKQLALNLGNQTNDWARDFGRIADFVMHSAFDQGRAVQIENQHGDDAQVYKDVYYKACKHCVRLYLTDGPGSEPKIFKLKDIQANGTNIGRTTNEWLPVIGATHPWCRCTLAYRDEAYDWDAKTQSFNKPKEYKRKIERKSKIKVTIGNTTIMV